MWPLMPLNMRYDVAQRDLLPSNTDSTWVGGGYM